MPMNSQKVMEILFSEVDRVQERCDGYRNELKETIAEIMLRERDNRVRQTNIQQQVNDRCEVTGGWLADHM